MYIRKEHNPNTYGLVIFLCYISMDAPYVCVDSPTKKRVFSLFLQRLTHAAAACETWTARPRRLVSFRAAGAGQTFRRPREAG